MTCFSDSRACELLICHSSQRATSHETGARDRGGKGRCGLYLIKKLNGGV